MYLITGHIFTGLDFSHSAMVEKITKNRLIECKNDPDCYIFNLENLTYFNPKTNKWEKIMMSEARIDGEVSK